MKNLPDEGRVLLEKISGALMSQANAKSGDVQAETHGAVVGNGSPVVMK